MGSYAGRCIETPMGHLQVAALRYWKSDKYVNYHTNAKIAVKLKEKAQPQLARQIARQIAPQSPPPPPPPPKLPPPQIAPKRKQNDELEGRLTAVEQLVADREQVFVSLVTGCIKTIRRDTSQAEAQEDQSREALAKRVKTVVKATELENLEIA
ncbi:hypothetical protein DFS34DRAFT_272700 [Phlyctochytrium arcticum]|nr:hypothetical protein DFS34DRAFT_272700 [Phlyctochytrium arcticum]